MKRPFKLSLFPCYFSLLLVNLPSIWTSPTLDQCTPFNTSRTPVYIGHDDHYCFNFFDFQLTRYFADQFCFRLGGDLAYLSKSVYQKFSLETLFVSKDFFRDIKWLSFWDHSDLIECEYQYDILKCKVGIPDTTRPWEKNHVACQFAPINRESPTSTTSTSTTTTTTTSTTSTTTSTTPIPPSTSTSISTSIPTSIPTSTPSQIVIQTSSPLEKFLALLIDHLQFITIVILMIIILNIIIVLP